MFAQLLDIEKDGGLMIVGIKSVTVSDIKHPQTAGRYWPSPVLSQANPIFIHSTSSERVSRSLMATWIPQPEGLQEIVQTIRESTDMSATVQQRITQASTY